VVTAALFSPFQLRGTTIPNRIAVAPMCQYSAQDGLVGDWHFAHLARFGLGGAGIVFVEATAVAPEGRITHGDVGLWAGEHVSPLRRITDFLRSQGSVPAIQLAHAGRKGSVQRPWHGSAPLAQERPGDGRKSLEHRCAQRPAGPAGLASSGGTRRRGAGRAPSILAP